MISPMYNKINDNTEAIQSPGPLFGLTLPELTALIKRLNQPPYRAKQLHEALYRQRVASLDEITTLPVDLRDRLKAEGYTVGLPEIVQTARSVDGTERYLIRMADGETVETVWMPDGDGGERGDGSEAAAEEAAEEGGADEAVSGKPADRRDDTRNWGALAPQGFRRATICSS